MRRAVATGISPGKMMFLLIWFYGCVTIEKIHPLEGGYLRRKVRRDRRPGLQIEHPLIFYPKYALGLIGKHLAIARIVWRMSTVRRAIKRDPNAHTYCDRGFDPGQRRRARRSRNVQRHALRALCGGQDEAAARQGVRSPPVSRSPLSAAPPGGRRRRARARAS